MPAAKTRKQPAAKLPRTSLDQQEKKRLWLMYPAKLITRPVIWELGHQFKVATNVRQASVTDEIGIVCLEIDGKRSEIKEKKIGDSSAGRGSRASETHGSTKARGWRGEEV